MGSPQWVWYGTFNIKSGYICQVSDKYVICQSVTLLEHEVVVILELDLELWLTAPGNTESCITGVHIQ